MIDFFKEEDLEFAPGTKWSYNNSGYFLLGYIIEVVSGKKYEDYIEDEFFKPLGMNNSYYGNVNRIIKNRTKGYSKNGDNWINTPYISMTQPYAAGSLLSTTEDLFKWYDAVMKGKVINKESMKKAHTEYKLANGEGTSYGYGWSLRKIQESKIIEHGGGINGFVTASMYCPEQDIFVAIFSNTDEQDIDIIAEQTVAIALGKPYDRQAVTLSEKELKEYIGVFKHEKKDEYREVILENGNLFSRRNYRGKSAIVASAKNKFFFKDAMAELEFERDDKGKITSVISKQFGRSEKWLKTDKKLEDKTPIKLDMKILETYVGTYELAPSFMLNIFVEDDKIFGQATGQGKFELIPYKKTKFLVSGVDADIEFNINDKKEVESLTLYQGGANLAKKVK